MHPEVDQHQQDLTLLWSRKSFTSSADLIFHLITAAQSLEGVSELIVPPPDI